MKKFLFSVCLIIAATFCASAQEGAMGSGIDLFHSFFDTKYGDNLSTFGIGIRYQYNFTDRWRLDNGVNIAFEKDDTNTWNAFVEMEYLCPVNNVKLYPLAGVMYGNMNHEHFSEGTEASFGFNFGGGIDIPVAYALTFNAELKYCTCKYDDYKIRYSTLLSAGFIYNF